MIENRIDILGHITEYIDSQSSGVPVFFIHGNSAGKEVFFPLINNFLGKKYRCIAFDLLGCDSYSNNIHEQNEITFAMVIEHMHAFISSFEFDQFYVVGHSLGGHLFLETAKKFNNVKGAFLSGVPPLGKSDVELSPFSNNPLISNLFKAEVPMHERKELIELMLGVDHLERDLLIKLFERTNPLFRSAMGLAIANGELIDEIEVLCDSGYPICLANGQFDQIVNLPYMDQFSGKVFGGAPLIIDRVHHYPQLERPEVLSSLIEKFIESNLDKNKS